MKLGTIARIAAISLGICASAGADRSKPDSLSAEVLVLEALHRLQEPLLHEAEWDKSVEIFRMVALPGRRPPLSVRVTRWPSGSAAATVRLLTFTKDPKQALALERAVAVAPEDMQALRDAISKTSFWKLPTPWYIEGPNGITAIPLCVDGTFIVIEAVSDGRYHVVLRGCGRKEDLRPIAEVFKRIARPYLPKDVDEYLP